MPVNGHLVWPGVHYVPGKLVATGYKSGKRVSREVVETTGCAAKIATAVSWSGRGRRNDFDGLCPEAGGSCDLAVITVRILDAKGRVVPDACIPLTVTLDGPGRILGGGNGDPAWHGIDTAVMQYSAEATPLIISLPGTSFSLPSFNGLAQILVEAPAPGSVLHISSPGLADAELTLQ